MTPEQAQAHIDLATKSVADQRKANQAFLDSQLDAGDRILMRKAADSVLQLAQLTAANPT